MSLNSLGGIMSAEGTLDTSSAQQGARLVSMSPGVLTTRWSPTHFGVICLIAELRLENQRRLHDNLHAMGVVVDESSATVGDA